MNVKCLKHGFNRMAQRRSDSRAEGKEYEMKVTQWFQRSPPVNVGIYQVATNYSEIDPIIRWCGWDGTTWGWTFDDQHWAIAENFPYRKGAMQNKVWRGLAEKPKGMK